MNQKNFYLVLSLFFFSFISLSSGQQGTNPNQLNINADVGLQVFYPNIETLPVGTGFDLHIHVSNISNGLTLPNTNVTCMLHLYNSSGNHLIETAFGKDSNGIDHEYFIDGKNFTQTGLYPWNIYCTQNSLGGEATGTLKISSSEQDYSTPYYFLIIGLIYMVALVGFFGKNETVSALGGFAMMFLGLWLIQNGIADFRTDLTRVISIVTIALGAFVGISAGLSLIEK